MTKRHSRRSSRRSSRRHSARANPRRMQVHRVGGGLACYDDRTGKRLTKIAKTKRGKIGTRLFCGKSGQKFSASHAMAEPPMKYRQSRKSRLSTERKSRRAAASRKSRRSSRRASARPNPSHWGVKGPAKKCTKCPRKHHGKGDLCAKCNRARFVAAAAARRSRR